MGFKQKCRYTATRHAIDFVFQQAHFKKISILWDGQSCIAGALSIIHDLWIGSDAGMNPKDSLI
jgi:hypothetical protein